MKVSIDKEVLINLIISHSRLNMEEYNRNPSYNNEHYAYKAEDDMLKEIIRLGILDTIHKKISEVECMSLSSDLMPKTSFSDKKSRPCVIISLESGSDPRIFSSFYKVPLKIYADDKMIFKWSPES
jgi:hypothetical protein